MGYIDVLIPLSGGLAALLFPDIFLKSKDETYEKKKSILRKCGFVLIGVALLYFIIKTFTMQDHFPVTP